MAWYDYCVVARFRRWSLALVLSSFVLAMSPDAGRAEGPEVERWLDPSQPFSLGVDTSRFRVATPGTRPVIATEDPVVISGPYRLLDSDLLGTAVSFDLKLRWPLPSTSAGLGALAPYLSFGPTLLVPGAEGVSRPGQPGARGEGPLAVGLTWGAGLSWRLTRNAELYSGYRFLQFGRDSLSHDRSESDLTGHDVLYGISVRF
jgi:hypothetical protein